MADEGKANELQSKKSTWVTRTAAGWSLFTAISLAGGSLGVVKYFEDSAEEYEREIANRAITIIDAQHTAEQAAKGAEFADCWPYGTCDGYDQLPVDRDQNAEIQGLQFSTEQYQKFLREHCQAHRDNHQKWHDCSDL